MKRSLYAVCIVFLFSAVISSCATTKVAPNAVTLQVEYGWKSSHMCSSVSPEIKVSGIPTTTKQLKVTLTDLDVTSFNHGGGTVKYVKQKNSNAFTIPAGALKDYTGPCPPAGQHSYSFKVDAIDASGVIVGSGKKKQSCCP